MSTEHKKKYVVVRTYSAGVHVGWTWGRVRRQPRGRREVRGRVT